MNVTGESIDIHHRVFQEYYQKHQLSSSTPSDISWIGSLQMFFLFSSMIVGGPLFDQYGATVDLLLPQLYPIASDIFQFLSPSALLYILSVFLTSICTKYWHFVLAQGILGGASMGLTMAPVMSAVGHYFNKKRGAAMGLAISGSSLGGIVFPIMLGKLLYKPNLSFGWTIRISGFIMLALIAPACVAIRARLPRRKGRFVIPAALKDKKCVVVFTPTFTKEEEKLILTT